MLATIPRRIAEERVPEIFADRAERKTIQEQIEREPMIQAREITLIARTALHRLFETPLLRLATIPAGGALSGRASRTSPSAADERRLHQQQEFASRLVDSFPDLILCSIPRPTTTLSVLVAKRYSVRGRRYGNTWNLAAAPIGGFAFRLSLYKDIIAGTQTFASLEIRVRHKRETGAGFDSISVLYPMKRAISKSWFSPAAMLLNSSV